MLTTSSLDGIEILNEAIERGRVRHALFDFDGTLSLIRQGWQDVMIPMMVEALLATPGAEDRAMLTQVVTEFVAELTGEQTIYQMIRLAQEVEKRGGKPQDPLDYKRAYLNRLWQRISGRVAAIESEKTPSETFLVPGTLKLLEGLVSRGVICYLASGTDHPDVANEAQVLGLQRFFGERIYGAQDDYRTFSKKMVIERILRKNSLSGSELVVFGDGYVEITDCKRVGGIAVGVASDEVRRSGVDEWKRQRLIAAGADLIIPHYLESEHLLAYLFAE